MLARWILAQGSWGDPWPRVLLYEDLLTAILYGCLPFLFAIMFVFIFVNIAICIQRYRVWWAHRSFVQEKVCSRSDLDLNYFWTKIRWFGVPTSPIVTLMTNKTLVTSMPLFNASKASARQSVLRSDVPSIGLRKPPVSTQRRNSGNHEFN